jgi:hypothetical protein
MYIISQSRLFFKINIHSRFAVLVCGLVKEKRESISTSAFFPPPSHSGHHRPMRNRH